jgi:hypothetical protein
LATVPILREVLGVIDNSTIKIARILESDPVLLDSVAPSVKTEVIPIPITNLAI